MERHFDSELRELKSQLLGMAGNVERAIQVATEALQEHDESKITVVLEVEKKVNQSHITVDESCLRLLALQQPLAADLRFIVAIIKINSDLERMGDQAVNIARNSERYMRADPFPLSLELPEMSIEVKRMVRETLDAFVKVDANLARNVLVLDDKVDAYKNKIFRQVLDFIKVKPECIEQGLNLILIARNLERIGDHATNIAEDVIFAISGEDVRHSSRMETIREALKRE